MVLTTAKLILLRSKKNPAYDKHWISLRLQAVTQMQFKKKRLALPCLLFFKAMLAKIVFMLYLLEALLLAELDGTHNPPWTGIATYRLNQSRGKFSVKYIFFKITWMVFVEMLNTIKYEQRSWNIPVHSEIFLNIWDYSVQFYGVAMVSAMAMVNTCI